MPFKIVRNDITKMNTDAIVNTANTRPVVGEGCDSAVYEAAGYEELLKYRSENIGHVKEGEAFITPGFKLYSKYIIHAVSPLYIDGKHNEEKMLRDCYKNSLKLAKKNNITSIAFPLISTGGFGYPNEEGMRIAVDEINAFLLKNDMLVYLVVFDEVSTSLGEKIYPDLEKYIDMNYVRAQNKAEYFASAQFNSIGMQTPRAMKARKPSNTEKPKDINCLEEAVCLDFYEEHESKLEERMRHISDTFSEYLMYLIHLKGMHR